jgi:hypothetical protein
MLFYFPIAAGLYALWARDRPAHRTPSRLLFLLSLIVLLAWFAMIFFGPQIEPVP